MPPVCANYSVITTTGILVPGLVDVGNSKHFRVNHGSNEFARGTAHVNGIEGFWNFAERRLQKCNGVSSETFNLHLKGCEYRFTNRNKILYREL